MTPAFADEAGPSRFAEASDGVMVAYRRFGADTDAATEPLPPVLLVHGFASTAAVTWLRTGWAAALQRAGRDVVALDLRGHGESDRPVDPADYRIDRLGADLAAVLDAEAFGRADVVGYSMGTRVAAAFARLQPERVRRIVIGGAGPTELFAAWNLEEARGLLLHDEPASDDVMRQVLEPALRSGADRAALLACIEGVSGSPLEVPRGIPALFVAGSLDPVAAGAPALAADRGSAFLEVPGRDHVSTLTSRAFKDAARAFLEQ